MPCSSSTSRGADDGAPEHLHRVQQGAHAAGNPPLAAGAGADRLRERDRPARAARHLARRPSAARPAGTAQALPHRQAAAHQPDLPDLYRTETLEIDQRLKITSLTFLFTDLRGSTALYERVGDLNAYDLVKAHFRVLHDIVASEQGAVVKTIGDAVMATFPPRNARCWPPCACATP
jgi:hypothetical protein